MVSGVSTVLITLSGALPFPAKEFVDRSRDALPWVDVIKRQDDRDGVVALRDSMTSPSRPLETQPHQQTARLRRPRLTVLPAGCCSSSGSGIRSVFRQ